MKKLIYNLTREPFGEEYKELLKFLMRLSNSFYVIIRDDDTRDKTLEDCLDDLRPYLISGKKTDRWASTQLQEKNAALFLYRFNERTLDLLTKWSPGLYGWVQPWLPEDITLLRIDGSVLLGNLAHHKESWLQITETEKKELDKEFPDLLSQNLAESETRELIPNDLGDIMAKAIGEKSGKIRLEFSIKYYEFLINSIRHDIDSQKAYKNWDNYPNLGFPIEFSKELRLLENDVEDGFYIIDYDKNFLKKIKSNKHRIDSELSTLLASAQSSNYLGNYLKAFLYKNKQCLEIGPKANIYYWFYDFYNCMEDRELFHNAYCFLVDYNLIGGDKMETIQEVRYVDQKLQSIFRKSPLQVSFYTKDVLETIPKSHWWYYLHEVDKLSEEDLETI